VLATLRQAHLTLARIKAAAKALLDAIAGAILTQTFTNHTVDDLRIKRRRKNPILTRFSTFLSLFAFIPAS
jgi:2'-5' RNA ligase